jgi:hypothetical protein
LAIELGNQKRRLTATERRDLARRIFDDGGCFEDAVMFTGLAKTQLYELRREVQDRLEIAA